MFTNKLYKGLKWRLSKEEEKRKKKKFFWQGVWLLDVFRNKIDE